MTAPELEYVALVVEDPQRSAAFFEQSLGLPRCDQPLGDRSIPVVAVGRSALALFQPGDAFLGEGARKGVHHIAMAAEDPVGAAVETGLVAAAEVTPQAGLGERTQVVLDRVRTCGVRTRLIEPWTIRGVATSSMVERIDHLGVASADNKAARRVFIEALRCVYESQQTDSEFETLSENFTSDTYPMVFHTRPTQLRGSLRVTFITLGDCELEFLQDLSVAVDADEARHDAAGNTRGDRSTIARFVNRHGQGLHHLALKTPDIDRTLGRLADMGNRMIDAVGRPGSRRARIGFVHPSSTGGVLLHFVEREEI